MNKALEENKFICVLHLFDDVPYETNILNDQIIIELQAK